MNITSYKLFGCERNLLQIKDVINMVLQYVASEAEDEVREDKGLLV